MRLSDENTRKGRHLTPEERIALQAQVYKEIKQLQQENNSWQKRYDELDAGHSRLFKDFCKLQQENEKLKATLADKDEKMKRLEGGLKKLRSSFQWLSESIRDLGYRAWAEDNIDKIDALLGGAEDVIPRH